MPAREPAREPGADPFRSVPEATVLVVEDDEALRIVASRVLRRHGYTVLTARNGAEALAVCGRHGTPIRVVLTDMVMPEMSGDELARRIAVRHGDIRVVLMSGYGRDAVARRGIPDGATSFLQKPFTPDKLVAAVHGAMAGPPNAPRP